MGFEAEDPNNYNDVWETINVILHLLPLHRTITKYLKQFSN